jgi:hypothetical protein
VVFEEPEIDTKIKLYIPNRMNDPIVKAEQEKKLKLFK